jgi:hypothetical protein
MLEQATLTGSYMYCIIHCPEPRQFATRGIGERGDKVYTVAFDDLAAVVSDSPVMEYDRDRRSMMAHTKVLEEVMQEFPILPICFSTVATSNDSIIEQLLRRRYGEMIALLDEIEGRKELGLKAFYYEEVVFRELVEENPSIRKLRDSLADVPAQQGYYERIRLGEMVKAALTRKGDADAQRALDSLCPLAYKHKSNDIFTDRMILNAAFLVDKVAESDFEQAVRRLDEEIGHRVMFKYVDQVPPYNFVSINIKWDAEAADAGSARSHLDRKR